MFGCREIIIITDHPPSINVQRSNTAHIHSRPSQSFIPCSIMLFIIRIRTRLIRRTQIRRDIPCHRVVPCHRCLMLIARPQALVDSTTCCRRIVITETFEIIIKGQMKTANTTIECHARFAQIKGHRYTPVHIIRRGS